MHYPLVNSQKPSYLLPQEKEVAEALEDYTDDPLRASALDFTLIEDLYALYLERNAATEILTRIQFGVALRRVFPHIGDRCTKRVAGRYAGGVKGLLGPTSIRLPGKVGRPRKSSAPSAGPPLAPCAESPFRDQHDSGISAASVQPVHAGLAASLKRLRLSVDYAGA